MSEPSANQRYHLILADIAMAAAIASCGGAVEPEDRANYAPGSLRDRWLARTSESSLRRRVSAMATAGVASLQSMPAERLAAAAAAWGVPFGENLAEQMADHFETKRDALLTYSR